MLAETEVAGLRALVLSGPAVRVTVAPDLGGKIASLADPRSGREWLWHNDALPARTPEYDASYTARFDSGGWDECFPSVSACFYPSGPWRGTKVPDHGELWGVPWEVLERTDREIAMAASCVRFPIGFMRRIALTETGLRLDYRAENPTPFDFAFVWCAHPLLAIRPGMELALPGDVRLKTYGRDLGQPCELPDRLPGPEAQLAIKAFGTSPAASWAAVRDGDAELKMSWDPASVTHLGIWLNAGGWAGVAGARPYYNLGLEPGIGAGDDLALAATVLDEAGLIPARGYRQWTLHLHLKP